MTDMKDKKKTQDTAKDIVQVQQTEQSLDKPQKDTEFAHASAKVLMDIVKKNNWAKRLGGQSEHLQYEAWQTVGKYYGYTVKTGDTEYVIFESKDKVIEGFKAKAIVVNEKTGIEVGSAEAYCTRDEKNWNMKPPFQLASMAQTRAGSKALRQILGFVVALAGYNPTPIEEMTGDEFENKTESSPSLATAKQLDWIKKLLKEKGYTEKQLFSKYEITSLDQLMIDQASTIIENLMKLQTKKEERREEILTDEDYNAFEEWQNK